MKVELAYFKPNGKFYASANYQTEMLELFNIWEEVKNHIKLKQLPGLIFGHSDFIVLVNVPEHQNNHPILLNTKTCVAYYIEEILQGIPL